MNKHIDSDTRYQIQIGLSKSLPISAIAQGIGYSVSTVYREIARNGGGAGYPSQVRPAARQYQGFALTQRTGNTRADVAQR